MVKSVRNMVKIVKNMAKIFNFMVKINNPLKGLLKISECQPVARPYIF